MSDQKPLMNLSEASPKSGGNGGKFEYLQFRVGRALGLQKLGCAVFIVPPGKRAFPYHAHSLMEELCLILEGSGTLSNSALPSRS